MVILETKCGKISGIEKDGYALFLGVPYARAGRFEYAKPVSNWGQGQGMDDVFDASQMGKACPQMRTYHEHLEIPERNFYHKEFRQGLTFEYDEDCLNLNIWMPWKKDSQPKDSADSAEPAYPVMIFIHGGGFDSGANSESPFDGTVYAKRGIVCVFINYRVGILGYLTHPEIQAQYGRNGNFGLDDQLTAIKWVKENIGSFGGDANNITLAGQSAGAISIQYLCLNQQNKGLFKNALMISGGGKFPDFALPRPAEETQAYWNDFMTAAAAKTFDDLKNMSLQKIFDTMDSFKATRKDNTYNTMPVIDGFLLPEQVQKLIKNPLKINYMLGYTNCDLYAPLMAFIGHKFAGANGAYVYFFDIDAKGDEKKAFHSSDLRYIFGTLDKSWRPYTQKDQAASQMMIDYIANFVKMGNPNTEDAVGTAEGLPKWKANKAGYKNALRFTEKTEKTKMVKPPYLRLTWNMIFKGKQI